MSEHSDVLEFTRMLGIPDAPGPRLLDDEAMGFRDDCLAEELDELWAAHERRDLPECLDALVDLVYFAHGTAALMGLPWEAGWNEVHRANMEKRRGQTRRGFRVDAVKPPGWRAPCHVKFVGEGPWEVRRADDL